MKKRILSVLLALCMVLPAVPLSALADGGSVTVTTFDDLKRELTSNVPGESADNPTTIVVADDIAVTEQIGPIENGKYKILVAEGKKTIFRDAGYTGTMFEIKKNVRIQIGTPGDTDNILTFDGSSTGGNIFSFTDLNNTKAFEVHSGIFQNCRGEVFHLFLGIDADFYLGENVLVRNNKRVMEIGGHGATSNFKIIIDGAKFTNDVGSEGEGIIVKRAEVIINNGLFQYCKAPVDGGAVNAMDGAKVTITGSKFENCSAGSGAALFARGSGTTIELKDSQVISCIADYNGPAIHTFNGSVLKISNSRIEDCPLAIRIEKDAYFEFLSGIIKNCDTSIRLDGDYQSCTFKMGGNIRIAENSPIDIRGERKITLASDLTCETGVANILDRTAVAILDEAEPGLIARNHMKFGVLKSPPCGIDETGSINTGSLYPVFEEITEEPPEAVITLKLEGSSATINTNVDIENAVLIAASYSSNGSLIDFEIFDGISVAANDETTKTLKAGFITSSGGEVKLMLWDSLDKIKPLTEAKTVSI